MKPGMPVFTTSLSLCLVSIRLISSSASSGRAEMLRFSRARAAVLGVVSKAVPRCTAQANNTCAGVFPTRAAIVEMIGSSSGPGFPVAQRRKGQQHNVFRLAEFQKLRFRQIGMRLDLDDGRLDSRRIVKGYQSVQTDIGE